MPMPMPTRTISPAQSTHQAHARRNKRLGSWIAWAAATGCLALASAPATARPPAASPSASAAPAVPAGTSFGLSGTTLQGAPFSLASLRGRVVLVYYWATDCAVCLDKMPELRANTQGWRDKPFTVVHVQMDKQPQGALRYWQSVGATMPRSMHTVLWRDEAGYRDSLPQRPTHLPFSVLVDTQGKIVASFDGRIPPEAWDQVAELLP